MILNDHSLTPRLVLQTSGADPYSKEPLLRTPSDYFEAKYPRLTKRFGPAFLEVNFLDSMQMLNIEPVEINIDIFAAILGGGDQHCNVVFYLPEQRWYAFDLALGYFNLTTKEHLKLRLSQELLHCAAYLNKNRPFVRIGTIFGKFRSDEVLESIVQRKSKRCAGGGSNIFR